MSVTGTYSLRYHPPAVHYPVWPGQGVQGLRGVLWLADALLAATLLLWRWQQSLDSWMHQGAWWLAVLIWVLSSVALARWLRRLPCGWLVWTGSAWYWHAIDTVGGNAHGVAMASAPLVAQQAPVTQSGWPVQCQIVLDVQRAMLLRLHPLPDADIAATSVGNPVIHTPTIWCWVSRASAAPLWHGLRCAVYGS